MSVARPLFRYLISPEDPTNTSALIVALSVENNTISVYLSNDYSAAYYLETALHQNDFMKKHNISYLHRDDSGHHLRHSDDVAELTINHYHLVHNETIAIRKLNQFLNMLRSSITDISSETSSTIKLITDSVRQDILKKFREFYKQQNATESLTTFAKMKKSLGYYYQKMMGEPTPPVINLTGDQEKDSLLLNAGQTITFPAANLEAYNQYRNASQSMPTIAEHLDCLSVPGAIGCTPENNFLTPDRFIAKPVTPNNQFSASPELAGIALLTMGLFSYCMRRRKANYKPAGLASESVVDSVTASSTDQVNVVKSGSDIISRLTMSG